MIIAYLCNQKKHCNNSAICGGLCRHTLDDKFALNGKCENPETDKRFIKESNVRIDFEAEEVVYFEE